MYFTESNQNELPSIIYCDIQILSSALELKSDYVVKYYQVSSPYCIVIYILFNYLLFYE